MYIYLRKTLLKWPLNCVMSMLEACVDFFSKTEMMMMIIIMLLVSFSVGMGVNMTLSFNPNGVGLDSNPSVAVTTAAVPSLTSAPLNPQISNQLGPLSPANNSTDASSQLQKVSSSSSSTKMSPTASVATTSVLSASTVNTTVSLPMMSSTSLQLKAEV